MLDVGAEALPEVELSRSESRLISGNLRRASSAKFRTVRASVAIEEEFFSSASAYTRGMAASIFLRMSRTRGSDSGVWFNIHN